MQLDVDVDKNIGIVGHRTPLWPTCWAVTEWTRRMIKVLLDRGADAMKPCIAFSVEPETREVPSARSQKDVVELVLASTCSLIDGISLI